MRTWLFMIVTLLTAGAAAASTPVGPILGPVPVVQVIDGDTVILESNLGPRVVRLIGIDAPETSHPEKGLEPFGPEATEFVTDLLPVGTRVWVELDFETEDAYGRLLAYLYIHNEQGDWLVEGTPASMVNLVISRAGFAQPLIIEPNSMYADLFENAVANARAAKRGIWQTMAEADSPNCESQDAATGPVGGAPIAIACTLCKPAAENDENAEWVSVRLSEQIDTRGYYLWDEGSKTRLPLPPGEYGTGELQILNPGQGIWNNGGDTIHLKRGDTVVDEWDYSDQRAEEGTVMCRNDG